MASFNKVILVGTITQDIELRYTPAGSAVCDVNLALNEVYYKDEQKVENTTFVTVTVWSKPAESLSKHQGKGGQILVEGKLQMETWDDRESGKKRSKLKVVAEKIQYLVFPKKGDGQVAQQPASTTPLENNGVDPVTGDDGIDTPF